MVKEFNGKEYTLVHDKGSVKCYIDNEWDDTCLITDKNDNILFKIKADCGQNSGFLTYEDA